MKKRCFLIFFISLFLGSSLVFAANSDDSVPNQGGGFEFVFNDKNPNIENSNKKNELPKVDFASYEFARGLVENNVDESFEQISASFDGAVGAGRDVKNSLQLLSLVKKDIKKISSEILFLVGRLIKFADQRKSQLMASYGAVKGLEKFKIEIDKDEVLVNLKGIGEAQLNTVDGHVIIRIKHDPTQLAFLILESDKVISNSKHLRQLVARQHIDAGTTRTDGQSGRDVAKIWIGEDANSPNGLKIEPTELDRRPKKMIDKLIQYFYATVEIPNAKRIFFQSLTHGPAQFAVAVGLTEMSSYFTGVPATLHASILSLVFSSVIGGFNSTYRQWMYRGNKTHFFWKSMGLSLTFSYIYRFWLAGAIDPIGLGLTVHLGLLANAVINNYARVHWTIIPKMRNITRQSSDEIYIGKFNTKIRRGALESEAAYLGQFSLKLLGILPGTEIIGNALYLLTTQVVKRVNLWYAEKNNFAGKKGQMESAQEMRNDWNRSWLGRLLAINSTKSKASDPVLNCISLFN